MNAYEFNKIAGAILTALLVTTVIGFLGNGLIHPKRLDKPVVVIEGVEAKPDAAAAAAPAALPPVAPLLASANAEAGKAVFKQCAACHTPDKGGRNAVGPNLWDTVGGKKGHTAGFAYSNAMQAAAAKPGEDGQWTYEQLNAFIANPKGVVPGTKMTFAGLRKPEDRANVIAYLRTLSDAPKPLP
jgi:cytochrome c